MYFPAAVILEGANLFNSIPTKAFYYIVFQCQILSLALKKNNSLVNVAKGESSSMVAEIEA